MAGKTGDEANKALHAKEAELQQSCGSDRSVRCDVVRCTTAESTICTGTNATTTCAWCLRRSFQWRNSVAIRTISIFRALITTSACCVRMRETSLRSPRITCTGARTGPKTAIWFLSPEPGGTFRELTEAQLAFERDVLYPNRIPESPSAAENWKHSSLAGHNRRARPAMICFSWKTVSRFTLAGSRPYSIRSSLAPR